MRKHPAVGLVLALRGDRGEDESDPEDPPEQSAQAQCLGCKQTVSAKYFDRSFELCTGCVDLLG